MNVISNQKSMYWESKASGWNQCSLSAWGLLQNCWYQWKENHLRALVSDRIVWLGTRYWKYKYGFYRWSPIHGLWRVNSHDINHVWDTAEFDTRREPLSLKVTDKIARGESLLERLVLAMGKNTELAFVQISGFITDGTPVMVHSKKG